MARLLIVGCGDLGGEVARLLSDAEHQVVGVRVSNKPLAHDFPCIQADVTHAASLNPLIDIKPDIIIYCVAANAQTDKSYYAHYVEGLRNVLATQENNARLKHVFFISSTRVYGQASSQFVDETVEAVPAGFGGERLLEAEGLLKQLPCGTTAIRLSGIYGKGRLYMVKLAKDLSRWPETNKWTNRIHRDDAASFIAFLCEKVIANENVDDCYIGTDSMPSLHYDVLRWLAKRHGVPEQLMPTFNVENEVGGKRLANERMRATGFQLKYANYQQGYGELLKNEMLKNG